MIERALVLGAGRRITLDDLPETLREPSVTRGPSGGPATGRRRTRAYRAHAPRRRGQQGRRRQSAGRESEDALPEADAASHPHKVARQVRRFPPPMSAPHRASSQSARQPGNTCSRRSRPAGRLASPWTGVPSSSAVPRWPRRRCGSHGCSRVSGTRWASSSSPCARRLPRTSPARCAASRSWATRRWRPTGSTPTAWPTTSCRRATLPAASAITVSPRPAATTT